jgi:hypothetical protein
MDTTQNLRDQLYVTPAEALYSPELMGLKPVPQNPDAAVTLLLARRRFPLPTVLICRRRLVRVADILALASGAPVAPTPPRKRGRPSKAAWPTHPMMLKVGHD